MSKIMKKVEVLLRVLKITLRITSDMKTIKTLINNEQMHHKMKTIRSQRHQLGSYEINKVSLSCFNDKHNIHDNGTSSYAFGHYKIK